MAAMMLVDTLIHQRKDDNEWDPHRSIYDSTGKIWAKVWLTLIDSFPTISGEPLMTGRPCLYVANHASWLDIPVLCTVLDPVFKFIAKGELAKVPCIGHQLRGVSASSLLFRFDLILLCFDSDAGVLPPQGKKFYWSHTHCTHALDSVLLVTGQPHSY